MDSSLQELSVPSDIAEYPWIEASRNWKAACRQVSPFALCILTLLAICLVNYLVMRKRYSSISQKQRIPPVVPHWIAFVGSLPTAVLYLCSNPMEFLLESE